MLASGVEYGCVVCEHIRGLDLNAEHLVECSECLGLADSEQTVGEHQYSRRLLPSLSIQLFTLFYERQGHDSFHTPSALLPSSFKSPHNQRRVKLTSVFNTAWVFLQQPVCSVCVKYEVSVVSLCWVYCTPFRTNENCFSVNVSSV